MVNLLCAGQAPPGVLPHLCGALLLASKKKGGGLRPIAVGEILSRLTAVGPEAVKLLSPIQLGVGVKGGCEAVVHAVSRVQEDVDILPEELCTLLLDFSNAFNSVNRREAMFKEVRARIPSMAAWMESCYGVQPILQLGDHTILRCCGVQQGDRPPWSTGLRPGTPPHYQKVPGTGVLLRRWDPEWFRQGPLLCPRDY